MGQWAELNDFSMYEGNFPCVLCKADSAKTLLGSHWKCSGCAHVFNKDGSPLAVECYCDTCHDKKEKENPPQDEKGMNAMIKKLEGAVKKLSKKKKVKKTK